MTTQSHGQGGSSQFTNKISSVFRNNTFTKSISLQHEASMSYELSKAFNAPAKIFTEASRTATNIISNVGDLETNMPLYISDYFDQLSDWSREHTFEQSKDRIGSNITGLQDSNDPDPACPNGPESALSEKFVKISWKLPAVNIHYLFNTSSETPTFSSKDEPSSGEVYRYFAFIDNAKQAISMNKDGSITRELYNFTDPAQLWRIDNYGKFYVLYNKQYGIYTPADIGSQLNNNLHEAAVYIVENTKTFTYSIGYAYNDTEVEYPTILKNLTLVTIPLVAWRNTSGQFLSVEDNRHGALGFSDGEQHDDAIIPKSNQLFLFVPHPDFSNKAVIIGHNEQFLGFNPLTPNKASCSYDLKSPAKFPFILFEYEQNIWPRGANYLASSIQPPLIAAAPPPSKGTRVRVWKSDPSIKSVGIRELFLINTDIEAGPKDSWFDTVSTMQPIEPDANGDFLLDFEDTPSQVPETDNHIRFDIIHTFSIVRYVFNLLLGDLEYLDGKRPALRRPWGKNKRLSIYPHAGEEPNAYYSRGEAALKFFYVTQEDGPPVYLCRSLDVVSHEAAHAFLDILQPNWSSADGQAGALHEAFGDLMGLFVLISMADIADLFVTMTKANLRDPDNFLSAVGEEFGDLLFDNKGKGIRNLSNDLKGSEADSEVHDLSMVFSGFYYDVLVDVFALERNPTIRSDTETLINVATNLRRALVIAVRVSSALPKLMQFQEIAINLEAAIETLGRRSRVDLTSWKQIVRKKAKERELFIAGFVSESE